MKAQGPTPARSSDARGGHTHSAPPPQPYAPDGDVHLLDRIAILYRYRRISLSVFVLATATMMIQGFTNTPIYQARAQLEIQDERSTAIPGLSNTETQFYEDPEPYYNTQYKILKGRDLKRRARQSPPVKEEE